MKITKTKLKKIIKEEFEAVMEEKGFLGTAGSMIKKGFKKVTGSYAGDMKKYDPWADEDLALMWTGSSALLDAIAQQGREDDVTLTYQSTLNERAALLLELLNQHDVANEKFTNRVASWLEMASNASDVYSLRQVADKNAIRHVREQIKDSYELATGQSDMEHGKGAAQEFLSIISGEFKNAASIHQVVNAFGNIPREASVNPYELGDEAKIGGHELMSKAVDNLTGDAGDQ